MTSGSDICRSSSAKRPSIWSTRSSIMLPIVAHAPDQAPALHRRHPRGRPGRHLQAWILRHRPALFGAGYVGALLAVVGPGVLAGLSDDDPAGITMRSIRTGSESERHVYAGMTFGATRGGMSSRTRSS